MQRASFKNRRGVTFAELIVASALLIGGMSLVGRLTVSNGRLLQQSRQDRLAMDEITNQLEWLTTLPSDEVAAAIKDLAPSKHAVSALSNPTLNGELFEDDEGKRVTLSIQWEKPQPSAPIRVTAWLPPVTLPSRDTTQLDTTPLDTTQLDTTQGEVAP